MFGHHQPDDVAPMPYNGGGVRADGHVRGGRRDAGSHEAAGFFVLHEAHAAGSEWLQIRVVAERRDLDSVFQGRVEDAGPRGAGDIPAVDGQVDVFQGEGSLKQKGVRNEMENIENHPRASAPRGGITVRNELHCGVSVYSNSS